MAYRYLFLLLDAVDDMYTARKARTLTGRRDTPRAGRSWPRAPVRSSARPTSSRRRCTRR
ncbi:hypothetical protein GCM10020218_066520 [Dactylosporangium vinaceum]